MAIAFISCARVETVSPELSLPVCINHSAPDTLSIQVLLPQESPRRFSRKGRATVQIPRLQGGYSSFLGGRFNVHEPLTDSIIAIRKGQQELRRLSPKEVQSLPINADGCHEISLSLEL